MSIPLNDTENIKEPSNDLIYNGQSIDSSKALKLKDNGIDISLLDPKISNLYKNTKLSTNLDLDLKGLEEFNYVSPKVSPTEIFRFFATTKENKKVLLTASLDNHTNVIRSLLLRKLGFDINRPELKKEIVLNFDTKNDKDIFLENLSEQTLTSRTRWIIKEEDKKLNLRHILLDQTELTNVNLYLPVMSRSRQQERRVFRSLIALYVITDFSESVNKTPWSVGKVFNQSLILKHPYADQFKDVTEDDVKWITRKLNLLTREELKEIIDQSNYPIEVKDLMVEKLIARITSLGKYLNIQTKLVANYNLSNNYVYNGKLNEIDFKDSAINYSNKDVESPYKFKELFRLFSTQAVFSGLSRLLDRGLEKVIPGIYNNEALEDIRGQITEFRRENPSSDGTLPVRMFSSPTLFGRIFANRNIVFGQVLDTNAAIQLVDSVGAEINLGIQSQITGITNGALPTFGLTGSLTRTYTHVRAMPDLKTASTQQVSKLLVPRLMKRLGRIIKDEYICSISKSPYVEEIIISEETFHYIKYDSKTSSKEEALKLREELLKNGVASNKILFVTIDRDKLCITDIDSTRNKTIEDFLKSFAENEIFIIADSIRLSGVANMPVALMPNVNLALGVDNSKSLLRSIQLKKIEDSIQVTITSQNDISTRATESISFYIQLARNSDLFLKGKLKSKAYTVNIKEDDELKKNTALRVIRDLFVRNDKSELYSNYKPSEVDQDVKVHLNTLKLLWFKRDRFKMGHDLTVIVPNRDNQTFSLKQRTRNFYQHLDYKRSGSDFHSFTNDVLGFFSNLVTLGQASNDPGKTFMGNSKKVYFSTEAELTDGYESSPTTRIEFIRSGWSKKYKKIDKYFTEVDEMFSFSKNYNPLDRTILKGASRLKSFDIRSTIILYPNAIMRLQDKILNARGSQQERLINYLSGKDSTEGIRRRGRLLKEQLQSISQSLENTKTKVKNINKIYKWLFTKFNISRVLSLIGEDNFFASTRVMGFLEDHQNGFLEYSSDSIGSYSKDLGTGKLDQLSSILGVSSYQLRALNYSPGM